MKKYIEKIKQRPIKERKKMATIFAVSVTLIIIVLWLIIMSFTKTVPKKKLINEKQFEGLINQISGQFSDVENKVDEVKDSFENIIPENMEEVNESEESDYGEEEVIEEKENI